MDSKNGNQSSSGDREDVSDFHDSKIESFEQHLRKRQDVTKPGAEITTDSFGFNRPSAPGNSLGEQAQGSPGSVTYFPNQPQSQNADSDHSVKFPDPPTAIFKANPENVSESEYCDLEQRILQYIQNDLREQNQQAAKMQSGEMQSQNTMQAKGDGSYIIETPHQMAASAENVSLFPVPSVAPKMDENIDINMLERWLDSSPKPEQKISNWVIVCVCIIFTCVGILIGGGIVGTYMNHKMQKKLKIEKAYHSYKLTLAGRSQEPSSKQFFSSGVKGDDGGSNASSSGGNLSALAFSVPVIPAAQECIDKPDIKLSALDGGRTNIAIVSKCHRSQVMKIEYANLTFKRKFDEHGKLNFILDCFAGDKQPIVLSFDDKLKIIKNPVTKDLDKVTKVAVIWSGSANLNLHAFEYGADQNKEDHIWENNPLTFADAIKKVKQSGRGHGFLSSYKSFGHETPKLEVYTFLNSDKQRNGVIKLALDYRLQPNTVHQVACHSQGNITIDYTTTLLVKNRNLQTSKAASILDPCKIQQKSQYTLNSRAVQDLVFRR